MSANNNAALAGAALTTVTQEQNSVSPIDGKNDLLKFSYYADKRDNHPKPIESCWGEIVELLAIARETSCTPETCKRSECAEKNGPAWSVTEYLPDRPRGSAGVAKVGALVLDIDHVPSDDKLAEYLERIPYKRIIHASHSDKPGDRCVRVVIALSRPVPGPQWSQFWTAAVAALGIPVDAQTKDAARLFFLPSRPTGATSTEYGDGTDYLFASIDGPALDVDAILATAPVVEQTPPSSKAANTTATISVTDRESTLDALAAAWPAQGRHIATLHLCGALAHAGWSEDDIADYVQDLRDRLYPDGDPTPGKARSQARDAVRRLAEGLPVAGWNRLVETIGEDVTAKIRPVLDSSKRDDERFARVLTAVAKSKQEPTRDDVKAKLKSVMRRLSRRTNTRDIRDHDVLSKVLALEQLTTKTEEQLQALADALKCLVRHAPDATDVQLAELLLHVFPFDVGQGDATWSETLVELVRQTREEVAAEAQSDFVRHVVGISVGKPIPTEPKNIELALRKLGVELKYNEFSARKILVRNGREEIFQDHHRRQLRFEIKEEFGFLPADEFTSDCVDVLARRNTYHPARDYYDRVEAAWDGVPRLDTWLSVYGGVEDNEYTRAVGRLPLIATVRRVRQPGTKFDEMLILEGEQGTNKTQAVQTLCPDKQWYVSGIPLDADSKLVIERTRGKTIVEAGELKGLTKGDIADLKEFMSRDTDESRMAFGRETEIVPRQFIIVGTTNEDSSYLRDDENRRFWPVWCAGFDLDALRRDIDQLYGEAAALEAQGVSIQLDPRLWHLAGVEQHKRRLTDPWEEVLGPLLGDCDDLEGQRVEGPKGKIAKQDLWSRLGLDVRDVKQGDQSRLTSVMKVLGWRVGGQRWRENPATKERSRQYCYVKGDTEAGGKDDCWLTFTSTGKVERVPKLKSV